jgi:hypothetical protein
LGSLFVVALVLSFLCKKTFKKKLKKIRFLWLDLLRIATIIITFAQISSSIPAVVSGVVFPDNFVQYLVYISVFNLDLLDLTGVACGVKINHADKLVVIALVPVVFLTMAWFSFCCAKQRLKSRVLTAKQRGTLLQEWELALEQAFDLVDHDGSNFVDGEELAHLLHIVDGKRGTQPTAKECKEATRLMKQWLNQSQPRKLVERKKTYGRFFDEKEHHTNNKNELSKKQFVYNIFKENRFRNSDEKQMKLVNFSLGASNFGLKFGVAFQMLFIAHSPISQTAFQWVDCRSVGTSKFMHVDYSMDCASSQYRALSPLAWTVIVAFSCGMPIVLAVYVFIKRKTLRTPMTITKIGWMYSRYTIGSEWWDIYEVIRKLMLTGVLLVFKDPIMQLPLAIAIQMVGLALLNRYHPHKSKLVFTVCLLAYCATLMKYVGALQLKTLALSDAEKLVKDQVGWWLLSIDLAVILAALVAMLLLVMLIIAKLKEADAHEEKSKDLARRKSMFKVEPVGRELELEEKQKQRRKIPASGKTVLPASLEVLADLSTNKKKGRENSEELHFGQESGGTEETTPPKSALPSPLTQKRESEKMQHQPKLRRKQTIQPVKM